MFLIVNRKITKETIWSFIEINPDLLGRPIGEPGQEPGDEAELMGVLEMLFWEMVFSLHLLLPNRADTRR